MSKRVAKKAFNIKAEIIEPNDPRIRVCKYCKRPGILLIGTQGFGFYTLTKHGKKYKTTKSVNHHASKAEWAEVCKEAQREEMRKYREKRSKEKAAAKEKAEKERLKAEKAKKKKAAKKVKKKPKKA